MKRALLLLSLAACARAVPAATVEASGVSLTASQVNVAAVLAIPGQARAARIEIELVDGDGSRVAITTDSLPPCTGSCPWAATFRGEQFGERWREIRSARIEATLQEPGDPAGPHEVGVRRIETGEIVGDADGVGLVYIISRRGTELIGGLSIQAGANGFRIPRDLLPPTDGEMLRAVFYETDARGD